jgi:hypothetical protein
VAPGAATAKTFQGIDMTKNARALAVVVAFLIPLTSCAAGDPSSTFSGSWQLLPDAETSMGRHEHGYVQVGELFYLVGGRGERPVEIFDPATGTWTVGAAPPIELHHFQALEHDGMVYVIGAMTGGFPAEPPAPRIYIYDPATDAWRDGPEIPEDRRRGGAGAVVHEGVIYLVAGIQNGHTDGHVPWLDAFDPRTGTWRRLADAPRPRDHFHAAVINGKIYAAGGGPPTRAAGPGLEKTRPGVGG